MLVYKAAYRFADENTVVGQVIDFPAAITQASSLTQARSSLGAALQDVAESHLSQGLSIPLPDPFATDSDADLEEPIYLVLHAGSHIRTTVEQEVS